MYEPILARTNYILPNELEHFTIDLTTAHIDTSIGLVGTGLVLTVIEKGTGVFAIKYKFVTGNTFTLTNADIHNGYKEEIRFVDILFTNEAQVGVINPHFHIGKYV